MIKIRYGCFETNSSSVHSLIIANEEEYQQLLHGELFINWSDLVTKSEVIDSFMKRISEYNEEEDVRKFCEEELDMTNVQLTKEWLSALSTGQLDSLFYEFCEDIQSYEHYMEDEYLESYCENYVSAHGDKIFIFGKFGRDC